MMLARALLVAGIAVCAVALLEPEEYDPVDYEGPWNDSNARKPLIYTEETLPSAADMGYLPNSKATDTELCFT